MLLLRLAFRTPLFAFKAGRRTARAVGVRRLFYIGVGVGIGVLVAPTSGAELRRRILAGVAARRLGTEPTVEERVRHHLQQSPRTWHLPQPEVVAVPVEDGPGFEVILAGEAADEGVRRDLEQAAASVTGVARVDNRLRLAAGEATGA